MHTAEGPPGTHCADIAYGCIGNADQTLTKDQMHKQQTILAAPKSIEKQHITSH